MTLHPVTGEVLTEDKQLYVFPATHYVAGPERMERAIKGIELELEDQTAGFARQGRGPRAARARGARAQGAGGQGGRARAGGPAGRVRAAGQAARGPAAADAHDVRRRDDAAG